MSLLDIFKKNKNEKKEEQNKEMQVEEKQVAEEPVETEVIAEYNETLETTSKNKKSQKKVTPKDEYIWRDVDAIEENIDNLHIKTAKKPSNKLDKKVDTIIEKTKKKHIRKPSNVIYVVSKPQPGQVRGDWAVRGHKKIYSHHRKKENAIKNAREIAKKRDATVMVQNTDGTFSDGFKPRSKK